MTLREFREKNYMTLADLAEVIGVSESYISILEAGKRHASSKIAQIIKEIGKGEIEIKISRYNDKGKGRKNKEITHGQKKT